MPIAKGFPAFTPDEAESAAKQLPGPVYVVKSQIHAGGRGKAGGVKIAKTREEAKQIAEELIGKNLVTYQTDANGQPVNSVLIAEDMYPIATELYLGAVVDRSARRVLFMASTEGGVEIEKGSLWITKSLGAREDNCKIEVGAGYDQTIFWYQSHKLKTYINSN